MPPRPAALMLPEVAVLVGRAAAHRTVLEGLLDTIPRDYWTRQAPGDAWNIRAHLAHVATADPLVVELVESASEGTRELWLGGVQDAQALQRRRLGPMEAAVESEIPRLCQMAAESRAETVTALASLNEIALEASVLVAGAVDAWGRPWRWSMREYLAGWATHDASHEASIRQALTTPPDLSTVMLTKRKQQGS